MNIDVSKGCINSVIIIVVVVGRPSSFTFCLTITADKGSFFVSNILVLNSVIPYPPNFSGNAIRVFPLSCELAKYHKCFLAAFGEENDRYDALCKAGTYEKILLLPERPSGGSLLRYFFLRTGHLARRSHPAYYREVTLLIKKFIEHNNIDFILAHTMRASEFVLDMREIPKILDQIDSRMLSLQRRFENTSSELSWYKRLIFKNTLARARYEESRFTKYFRFVTTVSRVDRETLQKVSRIGIDRIFDIPNGFSTELLEYEIPEEQISNSIAFWGALDFPPNSTAVSFFYDKVYLPYLSDKDITWYIIGRNASPEMLDMANRHDNIVLTGFIDDLYGLVSRIPIMINPMQMGGGLKNKVLEAFALKRLVVSSRMGIEAIDAVNGTHYYLAETPQQFADTIIDHLELPDKCVQIGESAHGFVMESYTWDKIGQKFLELIDAAMKY